MLSNILVGMLILLVILGLSGSLLGISAIPHLVWGGISYVALLVLVFLITKEFGGKSILLPLSLVAFADYNVQALLGNAAFNSSNALLHLGDLANAFILVMLVSTLNGILARTTELEEKISKPF